MRSREIQALDTMEQVVTYLRLRIQEPDVAIERVLDSIDADRHQLLAWLHHRDRTEALRMRSLNE